MGAFFTREERAVVLFLAASVLVGSLVLIAKRVDPSIAPDLVIGAERVPGAPEPEPKPSWPIDVNAAGSKELERLPGVGPVKASEIIRLRDERGGFDGLEDLLDVKGIGPKTLERLRGWAVVADTSTGLGPAPPSSPASGSGEQRAERDG